MADKPKVYIVIYSLYHHIYKLSIAIKEGLDANGIDTTIYQVQETLSDQVLEKMHAPVKPDLPVIQANQLADADGIIFGIPTRFGIFPAQMKALLDATGQLWAKGSLAGKFVGTFFSTASQHGGQETTALNAVTYFAHHGLMYVPFGFSNKSMFDNSEVIGGSAYGSGTITNGDGSRQPSETELAISKNQGENFAIILNTYHRGKKKIAATTGADSDASIRSLKAVSHDTAANDKDTPAITTTDPEGQTTQQKNIGAAAGAAAGVTGGAAIGAGVASAAYKDPNIGAGAGAENIASGSSANAPTDVKDAATSLEQQEQEQQQQQKQLQQQKQQEQLQQQKQQKQQEQLQQQKQQQQQQQQASRPSDTANTSTAREPKPTQEKPKKKSLMAWLCCSSE